ncbi:MAG: glycosyltransferase family 9 protein, partial [Sediminibacterium sp.]|nr:glycosyltransferase family 9 protein [Sediminibacterium sp.]
AKLHETARNQLLIADFTDATAARPRLYPTPAHFQKVAPYQNEPYICLAPASVWFTKQFPIQQWVKLLEALPPNYSVYLLGAPGDRKLCDEIIRLAAVNTATNLCGLLNLLESAALQAGAAMNYVNDSAPMHFASAMNAPVTAIYCSTLPQFGFGPLSENSHVVETTETLSCRPCGLHGKMACPEKHFRCANSISIQQLLNTLP